MADDIDLNSIHGYSKVQNLEEEGLRIGFNHKNHPDTLLSIHLGDASYNEAVEESRGVAELLNLYKPDLNLNTDPDTFDPAAFYDAIMPDQKAFADHYAHIFEGNEG